MESLYVQTITKGNMNWPIETLLVTKWHSHCAYYDLLHIRNQNKYKYMTKIEPVEKMLAKMQIDYNGSHSTGIYKLIVLFTWLCLGSLVDGAFDATSKYSLEIGVTLIVFGILCGFFGKRLVKPVSFLTGFLVGAGLSLTMAVLHWKNSIPLSLSNSLDLPKILVVAGAGGTVMGVLMFAFYRLIIYGILGGFISFICTMVTFEFSNQAHILQYPIASAAFIVGTFIASLLPTFSTIVVTSGLGSYLLSVGIDCILKSGFNHIFAFGLGYKWSQVGASTSDEVFSLFAFWIILFLWMGIRQILSKTPTNGKSGKIKVRNNQINSKEILNNLV